MKNNISLSDSRVIGIDILKILAIFLVTVLHIVGLGGAAKASESLSTGIVLSSVYGFSFCCINLFALATGFLYYGKKVKYSRLLSIWAQVIFWALAANILPAIYLRDFSILFETPFVRLFVVSFNTYWYFDAYFALFFFIPLLNTAIEKFSEKFFSFFLFTTTILLCVLPFLFHNDLFVTQKGYSVIWLMWLYIVGAGFRKFNYTERIKSSLLVFVLIISALIQCGLTFLSSRKDMTIMGVNHSEDFLNYNFIATVLVSFSLFLLVSKINFKNNTARKITVSVSSASFAVYLIQCNHSVMREFIEKHFKFIGLYSPVKAIAVLLGISLAFYLSFTVLGIIQAKLFKLCRIDKLCNKLEELCRKMFNAFYSKILCKCVKN